MLLLRTRRPGTLWSALLRWRRPAAFVIALLAVVVAYWEVTSLVAYTGDAYVTSDLVGVAPQVGGRVVAVHVRDNQSVHRGDKLVTIDRVPPHWVRSSPSRAASKRPSARSPLCRLRA